MFFPPAPASLDHLLARHGARYKWLVLLVVGVGTVAGVLSTSSFNVAVPALTRHFGLAQDQVQWAMTGFMAALTVAMLPTSWWLDRFGFRRVFLCAVALLALASVAGSLAPGFAWLVGARVLQGVATGVLQPLGALAVMRLFAPHSQGRASGVLSFCIVLAPAVGPALGGVLLDRYGWQAIFLINLPFCLLAGVFALYLLPRAGGRDARPFDWPGLGLLTLATLTLVESVASLRQGGAVWVLAQLAIAATALVLYVGHARRAPAPLIHIELFRQRTFALGNVVSFAYGFGLYASTYLIPVFLQSALHFSATAAGVALVPSGIALALTIPLAGRAADRLSPRRITVGGLLLLGASFVAFACLGGAIVHSELIAVTVLGRVGLGLILPALSLATLRHLAPQALSQSSVVISYARQLGGVLGVAIAAVFVEWRVAVHGRLAPGVHTAYAQTFLLLAGVFAVAVLAACLMREEPRPRVCACPP